MPLFGRTVCQVLRCSHAFARAWVECRNYRTNSGPAWVLFVSAKVRKVNGGRLDFIFYCTHVRVPRSKMLDHLLATTAAAKVSFSFSHQHLQGNVCSAYVLHFDFDRHLIVKQHHTHPPG